MTTVIWKLREATACRHWQDGSILYLDEATAKSVKLKEMLSVGGGVELGK